MSSPALQGPLSQRLACSQVLDPAAVMRWFGAVRAQDYLGAKWSLGLRTENAHERDIDCALNDGLTMIGDGQVIGTEQRAFEKGQS